jgi:hypothetical protein
MELNVGVYRITHDNAGYTLDRRTERTNKEGQPIFINPAYYSTLQNACVALLGRLIKDGKKADQDDVLTARELIAVVKTATAEIIAAVRELPTAAMQ